MPTYKYLIVGGGMTADAAIGGIREVDTAGSIGLIGSEPQPPYNRPPLTKGLWKGKPLSSIWRKTEKTGVTLHTGRTVRELDPRGKRVIDDEGTEYQYERLLLATGGKPRRLPFGDDEVIYYRTLADYERLRALADKKTSFAVIGGGFIGSEIAAALCSTARRSRSSFPRRRSVLACFPPTSPHFSTITIGGKMSTCSRDRSARASNVTPSNSRWRSNRQRPRRTDNFWRTPSLPASASSPTPSWPARPTSASTTASGSVQICEPAPGHLRGRGRGQFPQSGA